MPDRGSGRALQSARRPDGPLRARLPDAVPIGRPLTRQRLLTPLSHAVERFPVTLVSGPAVLARPCWWHVGDPGSGLDGGRMGQSFGSGRRRGGRVLGRRPHRPDRSRDAAARRAATGARRAGAGRLSSTASPPRSAPNARPRSWSSTTPTTCTMSSSRACTGWSRSPLTGCYWCSPRRPIRCGCSRRTGRPAGWRRSAATSWHSSQRRPVSAVPVGHAGVRRGRRGAHRGHPRLTDRGAPGRSRGRPRRARRAAAGRSRPYRRRPGSPPRGGSAGRPAATAALSAARLDRRPPVARARPAAHPRARRRAAPGRPGPRPRVRRSRRRRGRWLPDPHPVAHPALGPAGLRVPAGLHRPGPGVRRLDCRIWAAARRRGSSSSDVSAPGTPDGDRRAAAPRDGFAAPDLSPREIEVLHLLVGGRSATQMATALALSGNTVRGHVQALQRKLTAPDREGIVGRARELGLL